MTESPHTIIIHEGRGKVPWTALLVVAGIAALLWFLFGRKGSGGLGEGPAGFGFHEGEHLETGDSDALSFVLKPIGADTGHGKPGGFFQVINQDESSGPYKGIEVVNRVLNGDRHDLRLVINGETRHGDIADARQLFKDHNIVVSEKTL